MSYGISGRDFESTEIVNADRLTEWIRDAEWRDLSYSETAGDLYGISIGETAPAASEGRLWWKPSIQKLSVYSRRGWVGLFMPFGWETRKLAIQDPPIQMLGCPRCAASSLVSSTPATTYNTTFTLERAALQINVQGGANPGGSHYVSMVVQETGASGFYGLCVGRGICVANRAVLGSALKAGHVIRAVANAGEGERFTWLASDSTQGGQAMAFLGICTDPTLNSPTISLTGLMYFWGGFCDLVKEPF